MNYTQVNRNRFVSWFVTQWFSTRFEAYLLLTLPSPDILNMGATMFVIIETPEHFLNAIFGI